jgi:hypothetical protein
MGTFHSYVKLPKNISEFRAAWIATTMSSAIAGCPYFHWSMMSMIQDLNEPHCQKPPSNHITSGLPATLAKKM